MAIGGMVVSQVGNHYAGGGINGFVVMTCSIAATGGLIFGYDLGISGGVTSMEPFLKKFFPAVYKKMSDESGKENEYCKFDSQLLTLFTSSLYLAALIASFGASVVTRSYGRKVSMLVGGVVFFVGSILNGAATNSEMLIIGRLLLGVGVGFANQSVPLYLSEMAPPKLRGALNIAFQMAITIGILVANFVNYGTAQIKDGWGWRLSLGLAAIPAAVLTIGAIFLPDTPNSLLERGHPEEAKKMLQKVRGASNVEAQFQDLVEASEAAKQIEHPWRNIMSPKYRPQLAMCTLIPFFQQLTGINVIMFYAPVLFKTLGFGGNASLMSAAITGVVNVFATIVSIVSVDKFGRRILFLEGGSQMVICQVAVAIIIGLNFGVSGQRSMTKAEADLLLVLICGYVAAFAWSWGPLGWLVPSEICPLEIRSAGQAINVSVNMFFTFVIGQLFLSMLCRLKFGLFFFFAVFVVIMTLFIYFFLPETKNVPIEEMTRVWKAHWFWGKYIADDYHNDRRDGASEGKSYIDQIRIFLKERKAIGCPSFLWFLPYVCVQVPCFVLWMTTIRRMSLDHHPGFDCGGAFWFQNLTESSHGALGFIFPVLIAALHYTNVQIAFRTSSVKKATGLLDVSVKYYKHYLDFLTLPIFFTSYYFFPQGSLLYWVTNGSLTCIQQLSLKQPVVREKLGLPDKDNSSSAADSADLSTPAIAASNKPEKQCKVSVEDLSPKELISLSVQLLSKRDIERAIHIIRLILVKDPESIHGLILMGQTLLQKGLLAEAIDCLERAISKLMLDGFSTEVESIDHLIIASQWAGAACCRQGKFGEGLVHLDRIGKLKEPDDPKIKAHYFDTLFLLSSALYNVGRREEAAEYLRSLTAYDPAYNEYLEQCENEDDSFGSDLANNRRRDY